MKEKTYFFNGMQKKIKLLATSLLCVGIPYLIHATNYPKQREEVLEDQFSSNLTQQLNQLETDGHITSVCTQVKLGDHAFSLEDSRIKGRGKMEDKNYTKTGVWESLPRGCCAVKYDGKAIYWLNGLRKFSWGLDFLDEAKQKFLGRASNITVYPIEKENGDTFHVGAFEHEGEKFWVSGSKNVHLVVRDEHIDEDLNNAAYQDNGNDTDRFHYAKLFSQTFFETLKDSQHKKAVLDFLSKNRCTFVGEAILPEKSHLVDYGEEKGVRFFAITRPQDSDTNLLAHNPMEAKEIFEQLTLKSAEIGDPITLTNNDIHYENNVPHIIGEAYKELVQAIAKKENSEGAVLYMTASDGNTTKTVALQKCKSIAYIIQRMLREITLNKRNGEEEAKKLLQCRLALLKQNKILTFPDKNHLYQEQFSDGSESLTTTEQELQTSWPNDIIAFDNFRTFGYKKRYNIIEAKQEMVLSDQEAQLIDGWIKDKMLAAHQAITQARTSTEGPALVNQSNNKDHWMDFWKKAQEDAKNTAIN